MVDPTLLLRAASFWAQLPAAVCACKPLTATTHHAHLSLKSVRQFSSSQFAPAAPAAACACKLLPTHHDHFGSKSQHRQFSSSQFVPAFPRVAAASGSANDDILPPASKEEAVRQAGAALLRLLEKSMKKQGPTTLKQKRSLRQIRLRVDIPLLEDSLQALLALSSDLLESFLGGTAFGSSTTVAVYLPGSSVLVGDVVNNDGPSRKYFSLDSSTEEGLLPPDDAVAVLVIAPKFAQAAALMSVAKRAGVRPVIVVNPEWSREEEEEKGLGDFLSSFCVAYSFVPLSIQGFFSKTEGAVLKNVGSIGGAKERPWLIFVKEGGGNYKRVGALKTRPTSADLENALYSSMAANSPVSKTIVFLRGLVSR